ncbi:MAG TPA: hypothetical protein VHC39_10170 [Rhizomicrobium sp.]|nr:hypothetical protein [Rhizomicrobium sp.]
MAPAAIFRRLIKELVFPVGLVLLVGLVWSFAPAFGFLVFVLAGLALFVWLAILAVRILAACWEKQWESAAAIVGGVGLSVILAWPVLQAGPYLHLAVMYPYYQAKIIQAHGQRTAFYWGGDGAAISTDNDYWLVYDSSGKVRSENGQPMIGKEPPHYHYGVITVRPLIGSFYLRTESIPD